MLAQALLLAAQPPAQVARNGRLRIGFLVVSFVPQAACKNVGYPSQQANLVCQVHQHLVERAVSGDAPQLHQEGACPARAEPLKQADHAFACAIGAHERRAYITVDVLPQAQGGHLELSEVTNQLQRKQPAQLCRSIRVVGVVDQHQNDAQILACPECLQRRQQHPVLVEDVGFKRGCREFFPGRDEARQRLHVAHHDDGSPVFGVR